ncbi:MULTISPECIES: response regulator transcription factor [unclassified Novosphingobium]|uniref:response regulator transcription factor n=1 Tax=unclassified Novosphingobium TaxID=2644732 RepID=UPI00020EEA56|nr:MULTISPECIES: response regulator transcription factor [unclassified Novosphingobium]CCA91960.1 two component LuxR family transcriptional regulator [Novosphingobium sp. PP1Y]
MYSDVCLVSECEITREGLGNILKSEGFNIIGSYGAIKDLEKQDFGAEFFFVLDGIAADDQSDAVQKVKARFDTVPVVILSERFDFNTMLECFQSGAQGYIVRSMKALPLTTSLRLAAMGERVLPPDLVDVFEQQTFTPVLRTAEKPDEEVNRARLSPRELDVLCCLMAGYSNKVIARELMVCEATVKVHVKAILRKLNVHNRTQAAIWASSRGLSDMELHA